MSQVSAGAVEGAKSGALVTGYGAIGLLAESITAHHWPWITPGAVTMATVSIIHAIVSAWQGFADAPRTPYQADDAVSFQQAFHTAEKPITPKKEE